MGYGTRQISFQLKIMSKICEQLQKNKTYVVSEDLSFVGSYALLDYLTVEKALKSFELMYDNNNFSRKSQSIL